MIKQCAAMTAAITMSTAALAQDGGFSLYGGADYVLHEVSITRDVSPPSDTALGGTERIDAEGSSIRLRVGTWLTEDFSFEVQGTVSSEEVEGPDTAELDEYYGAFLTARAQPFDWMDVLFPIGYSSIETTVPVDDGNGGFTKSSASNEGVAYGLNFQFRLGDMLGEPDSVLSGFGLGLGFMVYNSSDNVNVRGYNAGLYFGYDF